MHIAETDMQALLPLGIQILGNLLFCFVFAFLWKQSSVVYFGYWSLAWAVESFALVFTLVARWTGSPVWLAPHAFLEFAFALSLLAAANVGTDRPVSSWGSHMRALMLFPVFLVIIFLLGWQTRYAGFLALRAMVLSAIYGYSFFNLGSRAEGEMGLGGKLFRFTLLCLSVLYIHHAVVYLYLDWLGRRPTWVAYLSFINFYDFALQTLLAFAAMAMWIENQGDRVAQLGNDLDRVRRESAKNMDLDHLTGLFNRAALARYIEDPAGFSGVVTVCDMDNFKAINDRFGHLVGDEILRNVGNLIRSSFREQDEAFRWGGDEFVLLFRNENLAAARERMTEIQQRLRDFRVRGHGVLPISLSWGAAEAGGQPLRPTIDVADREMYSQKRIKHAASVRTAP